MSEPTIVLFGTPLSHFARKIRVLLGEFDVPFELVRPDSLLGGDAAAYGGNPLLRVPTLVRGGDTVIDSDHIARYLVGIYDPDDRFGVRSERVADLNVLAAINGIMANEVVLILAARGGLQDVDGVAYFRKLRGAIDRGLAWLDVEVAGAEAGELDYRDIALVCLWQHLQHYQLVGGLERYARIAARVARWADRPSIATTSPAASLSR